MTNDLWNVISPKLPDMSKQQVERVIAVYLASIPKPETDEQFAEETRKIPLTDEPYPVKLWASGGTNRCSDYLMSDGTIKTLDILNAPAVPQQDDAGRTGSSPER